MWTGKSVDIGMLYSVTETLDHRGWGPQQWTTGSSAKCHSTQRQNGGAAGPGMTSGPKGTGDPEAARISVITDDLYTDESVGMIR